MSDQRQRPSRRDRQDTSQRDVFAFWDSPAGVRTGLILAIAGIAAGVLSVFGVL